MGNAGEIIERRYNAPLLTKSPLPLIREGGQGDGFPYTLKDRRLLNGLLTVWSDTDEIGRAGSEFFQSADILASQLG